jgi:hypothetical protein
MGILPTDLASPAGAELACLPVLMPPLRFPSTGFAAPALMGTGHSDRFLGLRP